MGHIDAILIRRGVRLGPSWRHIAAIWGSWARIGRLGGNLVPRSGNLGREYHGRPDAWRTGLRNSALARTREGNEGRDGGLARGIEAAGELGHYVFRRQPRANLRRW